MPARSATAKTAASRARDADLRQVAGTGAQRHDLPPLERAGSERPSADVRSSDDLARDERLQRIASGNGVRRGEIAVSRGAHACRDLVARQDAVGRSLLRRNDENVAILFTDDKFVVCDVAPDAVRDLTSQVTPTLSQAKTKVWSVRETGLGIEPSGQPHAASPAGLQPARSPAPSTGRNSQTASRRSPGEAIRTGARLDKPAAPARDYS